MELNEEDLEKVTGGNEKTMPIGDDENTHKATPENLKEDNKGRLWN